MNQQSRVANLDETTLESFMIIRDGLRFLALSGQRLAQSELQLWRKPGEVFLLANLLEVRDNLSNWLAANILDKKSLEPSEVLALLEKSEEFTSKESIRGRHAMLIQLALDQVGDKIQDPQAYRVEVVKLGSQELVIFQDRTTPRRGHRGSVGVPAIEVVFDPNAEIIRWNYIR